MKNIQVVSFRRCTLAPLVAAALLAASPTLAQQQDQPSPMPGASGHGMMSGQTATTGSTAAPSSMKEAMNKMNKDMAAAPMTGDADHDFVAMMMPHHQGAIDMAQFELANGKDPAMRKLAQSIISAQQREIRRMSDWQAKHPSKP